MIGAEPEAVAAGKQPVTSGWPRDAGGTTAPESEGQLGLVPSLSAPMPSLLLALALVLAVPTRPGGTLTGAVVSADGGPLAGATAALYDADAFVTGAAAGADGAFQLVGVPPGTYRVRVSFVGYEAWERAGVEIRDAETTDLGAVTLVPDAALLGEAEVEAEREFVEQRVDRTVYNVAAQPVTAGGNALDALQTLPSVEVDSEGNLSLRGGQNVAVHLNGRPVPVRGAQLAALLRQISASSVERVEVMPNPSARYEPDGMAGIIDIVVKQNTDRGLSGGLTLGGGTNPSAQAGGNVAYQRGAWDASASYGYRYDGSGLDGTSTRVRFDGADQAIDQTFGITNGLGSHLATGTLDLTAVPGTVLGLSGTLGLRGGVADQTVGYLLDDGADAVPLDRTVDGDVGGLTADLALSLRREIGEGHRLTSEARWTRNDDDRDETFFDVLAGVETRNRSLADDRVDEASAQIDYVRPLAGVTVEVGGKATHRSLGNDRVFERGSEAQPLIDPTLSGAFDYGESVGAAYAQMSRGLGAIQVQAGLRAETAWRDVTPGGGLPIEDRFTSLYPSAFALWTFEPGTSLKASTSRRVNRPAAASLNPTPRFQDTLLVDLGNPELRPEYTTAVELALQYKFAFTVTPFYRRTTDVIRRRIVFDPATGLTTGTFQNLDAEDSYGVEATLAPRWGPLRGALSGNAYRSMTDGGSVESGLAADAFIYTVRGSLRWELRPGSSVQVFGFYRGPFDTEDGRVSAYQIVSVGASHQLRDGLQLSATVLDPFSLASFSFETETDDYRFTGEREFRLRRVSATLSYTFGRPGPPRRPPPAQQSGGGESVGF